MAALGNFFNIVIFVSLVGSVFSVLALLVKKVLHMALPLWFGVCGIALFLIPFISPALRIVSPEETLWIYGYRVASVIWLTGMLGFGVYYLLRSILANRALKMYNACDDERINRVYSECVSLSGLKKAPALFFGTLNEPACVVAIARSAVILNEAVMKQLSDTALKTVICHELMHVRRKHLLFQYLFDFASMIHWFNPFVWISRSDFAAQCEMDCDRRVLAAMAGTITGIEYATTMLRLMERSTRRNGNRANGVGALGFLLAKQRLRFIFSEPTAVRRRIGTAVLALLIGLTMFFSIYESRACFYPYPAFHTGPEYPADSAASGEQ